jgi:hypothetical protein
VHVCEGVATQVSPVRQSRFLHVSVAGQSESFVQIVAVVTEQCFSVKHAVAVVVEQCPGRLQISPVGQSAFR